MAIKYYSCVNFYHDPGFPCPFSLTEDEKIIVQDAEIHLQKAHGEQQGPVLELKIEACLVDPPAGG